MQRLVRPLAPHARALWRLVRRRPGLVGAGALMLIPSIAVVAVAVRFWQPPLVPEDTWERLAAADRCLAQWTGDTERMDRIHALL